MRLRFVLVENWAGSSMPADPPIAAEAGVQRTTRAGGVVQASPAFAHKAGLHVEDEAAGYNERTAVERFDGRSKEEFGANNVMVRGAQKTRWLQRHDFEKCQVNISITLKARL